jgi:demethylmenaquinone methyltransferase/2-methoxy-6-polyprenyl-1,4-benzoquinol methylase
MNASQIQDFIIENTASYERLNSIISIGRSGRWRRWVARRAVQKPGARVLDIFSGTGPVGLEAAALGAQVTVAGNSPQLLKIAGRKADSLGLNIDLKEANLSKGIALFTKESFDAITFALGIRYHEHPEAIFSRLFSLLKPGGRLVVLEYVVPSGGPASKLASLYFFRLLPLAASVASKHKQLFTQLSCSTKALGHEEDLELMLLSAGFNILEVQPLAFGLVYGVVATRGFGRRFDAIA